MVVNYTPSIFKYYESLADILYKKDSLSTIIKSYLFTVTNPNSTLVTIKTAIYYQEAIIVKLAKNRHNIPI